MATIGMLRGSVFQHDCMQNAYGARGSTHRTDWSAPVLWNKRAMALCYLLATAYLLDTGYCGVQSS